MTPGARPRARAAARPRPVRRPGRRRTPPRRARRSGCTSAPAARRAARPSAGSAAAAPTAPPSGRTRGSTSASRRGLGAGPRRPAAAGRRARPSPSGCRPGRAGPAAASGSAGRRSAQQVGEHGAVVLVACTAPRPRERQPAQLVDLVGGREVAAGGLHHPVVDPLAARRRRVIAGLRRCRRPTTTARPVSSPTSRTAACSGCSPRVELALGQRPVVVPGPVHERDLEAAVRARPPDTPPAARDDALGRASASVLTDAAPAARAW